MGTGGTSGSGRYPGRSTYGGDYQPGAVEAFGSGGVSGQWTMEGMSSLEPLEQSVLNTLLVARPMEGITETEPPERSARPMLDITQDKIIDTDTESLSRPMVDVALDRRPMEGITAPLPVESSGLVMAPGSGLMEHLSGSIPLEHSVSDMKV